jgi:hypothetical protein
VPAVSAYETLGGEAAPQVALAILEDSRAATTRTGIVHSVYLDLMLPRLSGSLSWSFGRELLELLKAFLVFDGLVREAWKNTCSRLFRQAG